VNRRREGTRAAFDVVGGVFLSLRQFLLRLWTTPDEVSSGVFSTSGSELVAGGCLHFFRRLVAPAHSRSVLLYAGEIRPTAPGAAEATA